MFRARGGKARVLAVVLLAVFAQTLISCGSSSEDDLSQADEKTTTKASNLGRSYLEQYSQFVGSLERARVAEAERSLNRMREISDTRLELVSSLENETLREFFVGAQRFTNRAILLYQEFIGALESGSAEEIDRLAKEEIRLSREAIRYLRTESRRLLRLDNKSIGRAIRKAQKIQAEFAKP